MYVVVMLLCLAVFGNTERCKFTIAPTNLFSSSSLLSVGSSCSNCDIILKKCYPSIQLSVLGEQSMDGFVTWGVPDTPAHNCATLGEVNITSLLSVSANIRIAVLPQPCSPQHDALHSHVNPLLFKSMASNMTSPLSSVTYSSNFAASLSQPSSSISLSYDKGKEQFLYSASPLSALINFGDMKESHCEAEPGELPKIYQVSPNLLVHLQNGSLTLISENNKISVSSEECFSHVAISSDIFEKHVFVISRDKTSGSVTHNAIFKIVSEAELTQVMGQDNLTITDQDNYECIGNSKDRPYSKLRFLDIMSIETLGKQLFIFELQTSSGTSYHTLLRVNNTLLSSNRGTCQAFPDTVTTVSVLTPLSEVASGSTVVNITRLYALEQSSPHVLAVGTVVLYSPCLGCLWYLLPVPHSVEQNYIVATDDSGRYVIQTSNSLFYGYYGECVKLSDLINNYSPSQVLKIQDLKVFQTTFHDDVGKIGQNDNVIDLREIDHFIRDLKQSERIITGFSENKMDVRVCCKDKSFYTRQSEFTYNQPYKQQDECSTDVLPARAYLQFGDTYSVSVEFSVHTSGVADIEYLIRESRISMNVWNGTMVEVERNKIVDYRQLKVLFEITISDIGAAVRAKPGESLTPVSVAIMPSHTNALSSFHVILGCKPGQKVSLSREGTPGLLPQTTDDVIHVQFEDTFLPRFEIKDLVSGTSKLFQGNYSFQITGGGQTIGEIKMFSEDEVVKYNSNGGSTGIWNWEGSLDQIKWLCRENSPCSNVYPKPLEGVPNFCFKIQFSNLNTSANNSYCVFEEEFTICVHGLPLGVWQSVITLGVVILVVVVWVVAKFIKENGLRSLLEELNLLKPDEATVEEEHAMFLREQMIMQKRHSKQPRDRRSSMIEDIRGLQRGSEVSNLTLSPYSTLAHIVRERSKSNI